MRRLFFCFWILVLGIYANRSEAVAVNQGLPANTVTLKSTEGTDVKLKDLLTSKVGTVVVFVATKCPYSNAYNARYNKLAADLKKKNIGFVPINSNDTESFDDVKAHATEKKFTFPVYKDEAHLTPDLFGAEHTPEAYLLDKNQKVVYHGRIDDDSEGKKITRNDLAIAADELAANPNAPKITKTEEKAFGCSIKRK